MPASLGNISPVEIDPSGVLKYVLIKVRDTSSTGAGEGRESEVTIVRATSRFQYHSDIHEVAEMSLEPLDCEPLGGGLISHDPEAKKIHIYGLSQGFGMADHEVTAKLIREKYPDYNVTVEKEN